jgi:hypothetical protein
MTIACATCAEVLVLHARYLVTGLDSWPYVEPGEFAEQTVVRVVRKLEKAGGRPVLATWSQLATLDIPTQQPPVPEVPGRVGPPALALTSTGAQTRTRR